MKKTLSVLLALLLAAGCLFASFGAGAEAPAVSTYDGMIAYIRAGLIARNAEFGFSYIGDDYVQPDWNDVFSYLPENGAAGDYLRLSFNGDFPTVAANGDGTYTVEASYLTDAAQEQTVDAYVAEAAAGCEAADEEGKARYAFDLLCEDVAFDLENLYDDSVKEKYTAYGAVANGRAVCQGFATLYYKLALALGLDCRVVTGTRAGENHAWNVVKIGDLWYHVDASCGAQLLDPYRYFMKSKFNGYTIVYEDLTAPDIANLPFETAQENIITGAINYKFSYTLNKSTGELVISGTGALPVNQPVSLIAHMVKPDYSIVIEEGITGLGTILHLGDRWTLKKLEIPASVISLENAFCWGCLSIDEIVIDENNPVYHVIDNCIVKKTDNELVFGNGKIPADSSVTSIGEKAFPHSWGLSELTIPDNITSISSHAFEECYDLTIIDIPDSVTKIETSAFSGCNALTSVTFGSGLIEISAPITASASLQELIVSEENPVYHSENNSVIETDTDTLVIGCPAGTIPEGIKTIGCRAFYTNSNLETVTIPDSVTRIDNHAFAYCNLKTITFGNGVTSIGEWAFSYSGLTDVVFPANITEIGWNAFRSCTSLSAITVPSGIETVPASCFSGCSGLKNVIIEPGVKRIGANAFEQCSGCQIYIPDSVISIGYVAVNKNCTIYGHRDSYAESWAISHDVPFRDVCPVTGRLHEEAAVPAAEATCTEPGYTAGDQCSLCGEWVKERTRTDEPLGHLPGEPAEENVVPATCTTEGSYDLVVRCERCGEVLETTHEKIAKTAHTDELRDGYCDECGEYICVHEETGLRGTVPAACTANGYSGDTVCLICGAVVEYGATLFAPGHSPVIGTPAKAATCLEEGVTAEYVCSVCGVVTTPAAPAPISAHTDADGDGDCDLCLSPVGCSVYGVCGEAMFWCVDGGTLVISGSGASYEYSDGAPWRGCGFDCVFVRPGAEAFDLSLLASGEGLERVFIPSGAAAVSVGAQTFVYSADGGAVSLSGASGTPGCGVYDLINIAYELCRAGEIRTIRFDSVALLAEDGELEYDIVKNGKIVDENHFRVPSGTVVGDLAYRPVGYPSFNAVMRALGEHPDRNLILSLDCGDLLTPELRSSGEAYTEQLVVRFVDDPGPDGNGQKSLGERIIDFFNATLAAILSVFKSIVKLFKNLFK